MEQKICIVCKTPKPIDDFYPEKRVKSGREPRCKSCSVRRVALWRKRNPERARDCRTKTKVKEYGITLETYKSMEAEQKGLCAICLRPPKLSRLSVDHDHKTGKIRKLLCERCNLVLGQMSDNVDLLGEMIRYLTQIEE